MIEKIQFAVTCGARNRETLTGEFDSVVYVIRDGKMYFSWLDRLMDGREMVQLGDTRHAPVTIEALAERLTRKGFIPLPRCKVLNRLSRKIPPVDEWRWHDRHG